MDNPANGRMPGTATPTRTVASEPATAAPAGPPLAETLAGTCACGHPETQHDAIARRYCLATVNSHLDRGCVCADTAASQA